MTEVNKVVFFVALILNDFFCELFRIIQHIMHDIPDLPEIPMKKQIKLLLIEKDQLFSHNFPYKPDTFLILRKLPDHIDLFV